MPEDSSHNEPSRTPSPSARRLAERYGVSPEVMEALIDDTYRESTSRRPQAPARQEPALARSAQIAEPSVERAPTPGWMDARRFPAAQPAEVYSASMPSQQPSPFAEQQRIPEESIDVEAATQAYLAEESEIPHAMRTASVETEETHEMSSTPHEVEAVAETERIIEPEEATIPPEVIAIPAPVVDTSITNKAVKYPTLPEEAIIPPQPPFDVRLPRKISITNTPVEEPRLPVRPVRKSPSYLWIVVVLGVLGVIALAALLIQGGLFESTATEHESPLRPAPVPVEIPPATEPAPGENKTQAEPAPPTETAPETKAPATKAKPSKPVQTPKRSTVVLSTTSELDAQEQLATMRAEGNSNAYIETTTSGGQKAYKVHRSK